MSELSYKELQKRAGKDGIGKTRAEMEALVGPCTPAGAPKAPAEAANPPARADRPTAREETGRSARVPLGTAQERLAYPVRLGYHRHWFNDTGNRLYKAEEAGYTFVDQERDGRNMRVSQRVGVNEDGSAMIGHLMEIRQEFYDEDFAKKQAIVDEVDAAITGGETGADANRFYKDGTSVSVDT